MKFAKELCVIGEFTNKYMDKRGVGTGSPIPIRTTNDFTNDFTDELTVPVNSDFTGKNLDFQISIISTTISPNISFIVFHFIH